jgi:prepilin signal peptidase PulO-like enzyme (type II secretory pathway)
MYNLLMLWFSVGLISLLGLMVGSAINAIVWRLYVGRSWVHGRSVCPECNHVLSAKDLIPIVSWLMLRARCRYCKARIHWQYPTVELITAILFGLSAYVLYGSGGIGEVKLSFWLVMLVMLIVLAVYDTRWLILPNKVVYPLAIVALIYAVSMAALAHQPKVLLGAVLGAILGFIYAIVAISKGRAMGGGDIKLAFTMGLILGTQGLLVGMFTAFNSAAVVGILLIALRRNKPRDQIPFGPFLVAGTIVAFLFARTIIGWYLGLNGLA